MAAITGARSEAELLLAAAATLQTWKKKSSATESVVLESVERLRHNTLDVVQTHSTVLEAAANSELVSLDSLISAVGQSVSYAKHPSCVLHLLGRLMMKSIHADSITAVLTRVFVDILTTQPKLWPLVTSQVQLMLQELPPMEHLALVQVLAPLAQSMALNSIVVTAECLRDMCNMLIQQICCYTTSLSNEGHLKNAVASVSSLVQVYLHLYVVNDDEALLAAASLCMDHFRSHMCIPLRLTDDTSSCHCLDLVLSHVCELTTRGLSVGYHLSVLKQHASGITRTALQTRHFVAISWLLCKHLMVPHSVQLLLSIVSTLLQNMITNQKIAFRSFVLLPLLQVAALPDVCCIGRVSKENLHVATQMLKEYLSWSHDACGSHEMTHITPLVSTPVYKDIVTAANLNNFFCQSTEALLQWVRMLVELTMGASETALLQSIVLIQNFPKLISSNHTKEALKALSSLAKDVRLGYFFLPAVVFCFPLLQDDVEKGHVLSVLPDVVRANKAGLGQVVALIQEFSKNAKLMPTMIRVLHRVWERQDAVYPHLHDLLIAPLPVGISSSSVVDILLSKAITAKEMCERRGDVHGTELLGIIAAYFDENTLPDLLPPGTRAMLLNVALAGLRALAEAEVIDKTAAFRNVVLKLLEDKRPLVQAGVCAFLEVLISAPLDPAVSNIAFPVLWRCAVSEEIAVSTAAWLTLSACDLNDLLLSDIPDMLRVVMGVDGTCSDDSPVTGKQVVALLPSIRLGAVEAFLCLLVKFLKHELNDMPKGAISTAVKKARMSSGYKGLDDILTALRNTSLPGLPSGLQLLVLEQHHRPSSDSRGRKQMMAAALQKSKSTLIDLLSKELYPSHMVLDQFVPIHQCVVPEEWDRLIQMVFQQSVEFAKMNKFQDDVAVHAASRQDLIQLIIDAHRVSHLREDNVLWTLVSLACLCDFGSKASITQPSVAAFEGQRFVHDVLSILTALATGALQDSSLGIWSSMVIMEIFAGWTCPSNFLVVAISSVLKSVLSRSEGIAQLVMFEDTVVGFLHSTIHTFKLSLSHEEMEQTAWLLGNSLNDLFSTTYDILPQVASVLSELLENVLMNDTAPSLALASLIPSMLMVEWSTEAVQHLFKQFVQDCATTIATPVKAVALSTSLCAMFQVNLLPQQLLVDYCESMNRLPLSQQYAPLHLLFGSTLHWLSSFGCSVANKQLGVCVPLWIRALQHPASQVCCCMALAGLLGVHVAYTETVPRPTVEMKETVLPPLLLALQQFLNSDDAPLRGTMIWLMVKVVLTMQETESDTSDLVPLDLSYLPEHQALPSIFGFLKEEANAAVAGSAVLEVAEKTLSSLVAVDGIPPADWSGILLVLYHKGGPLLQSRCLEFAFKFPLCGSIKFIRHAMVSQNFCRMSDNIMGVVVKALSLPNFPVVERCLWQLLYALCQVFHRGSLDLAQSVCGALLNHYNSVGKSQFNQHCHTRVAHTLVSVVMETAASQGVGNTPVSSPCVLHLLSEYLSTVLSTSLPQMLQCTSEENEEIKAVKCMLLAESTQFVKAMQWRKLVTSICDVSPVTDVTFARGIICLAKCLPKIASEEENVHVLIKVLLHYVDGAEGNRKKLLVWMIAHILSSTHKYDRSLDCMAVAGDLLLKGGLPAAIWEECLSASLYCAPTHASIDEKCMESVIELCFTLMPDAKAVVLNIVSAVVGSMSRQQRKASALLKFVE